MPASDYVVREVLAAPRLVAGVRAEVPLGRVGQMFGASLDQVYAAGKSGAIALDGQNVFIYRALTNGILTVDFCVGANAAFEPIGAVRPVETPSGMAAMTTHVGDYGHLGDANAAIHAWCREHGRRIAGPSWEVYGHWYPEPERLRTDVYYLLAPQG